MLWIRKTFVLIRIRIRNTEQHCLVGTGWRITEHSEPVYCIHLSPRLLNTLKVYSYFTCPFHHAVCTGMHFNKAWIQRVLGVKGGGVGGWRGGGGEGEGVGGDRPREGGVEAISICANNFNCTTSSSTSIQLSVLKGQCGGSWYGRCCSFVQTTNGKCFTFLKYVTIKNSNAYLDTRISPTQFFTVCYYTYFTVHVPSFA